MRYATGWFNPPNYGIIITIDAEKENIGRRRRKYGINYLRGVFFCSIFF